MPQLSEKMLEIHKATDAPLDHTVPPDFHPGQLTNIGRELEAAGGSLEPYEAARRAFASMYQTASDANAAVASAMRPCQPFVPTPGAPPLHAKIPDADCEQISSLIYSRVATASRAVDAVGKQLDDVVAQLSDNIGRTCERNDTYPVGRPGRLDKPFGGFSDQTLFILGRARDLGIRDRADPKQVGQLESGFR